MSDKQEVRMLHVAMDVDAPIDDMPEFKLMETWVDTSEDLVINTKLIGKIHVRRDIFMPFSSEITTSEFDVIEMQVDPDEFEPWQAMELLTNWANTVKQFAERQFMKNPDFDQFCYTPRDLLKKVPGLTSVMQEHEGNKTYLRETPDSLIYFESDERIQEVPIEKVLEHRVLH